MLDISQLKVSDKPLESKEMEESLEFKGKRRLTPDGEFVIKVGFGKNGFFTNEKGDVKVHIVSEIIDVLNVENLNGFTEDKLIGRKFHDFPRLGNAIDRRRLRQLLVGAGLEAKDLDSEAAIANGLAFVLPQTPTLQLFQRWETYDRNNTAKNPGKDSKDEVAKAAYAAKYVRGMASFPKNDKGQFTSTFTFKGTGPNGTDTIGEAQESIVSYGAFTPAAEPVAPAAAGATK